MVPTIADEQVSDVPGDLIHIMMKLRKATTTVISGDGSFWRFSRLFLMFGDQPATSAIQPVYGSSQAGTIVAMKIFIEKMMFTLPGCW
jgi:hypothetical protein